MRPPKPRTTHGESALTAGAAARSTPARPSISPRRWQPWRASSASQCASCQPTGCAFVPQVWISVRQRMEAEYACRPRLAMWWCYRESGKRSDSDRPRLRPGVPVQLDAFDLVQGLGGQAAFAAMGTTDDRHVLDDEEAGPLAVTARNAMHVRAALTTDIACHARQYSRQRGKVKSSRPRKPYTICAVARSIPARPPIRPRRSMCFLAGPTLATSPTPTRVPAHDGEPC